MKKGLIILLAAAGACAAAGGAYTVHQNNIRQEAYNKEVDDSIEAITEIDISEGDSLPGSADVLGNVKHIDGSSVQADISKVDASTPGKYTIDYSFKDDQGRDRTASVGVDVKAKLQDHVTGLGDIEIDYGDDVPAEPNCTFDEYVSSVTLDASEVDPMSPGTYDITYTIIGADGDMEQVPAYCTVIDTRPSPTPTPTPTPVPTPAPETEAETETEAATEADETETEGQVLTGNVSPTPKEVAQTGDNNPVEAIAAILVICAVAAAFVVIQIRKKKKDD